MRFPVFSNFKVSVFIAENTDATACYIADRDFTAEPTRDGTEALTVSSPRNGWANIYIPFDAHMGTIAHESYHAVEAMMKFIGANKESEVVAYHLGFLVDKIVEFNLKVAPRFAKRKADGRMAWPKGAPCLKK